jgi:hypothetical protein
VAQRPSEKSAAIPLHGGERSRAPGDAEQQSTDDANALAERSDSDTTETESSCSLRARWRLMGSAGCKAAWLKPHWPLLVWPCDGIRDVLCSLPRVIHPGNTVDKIFGIKPFQIFLR